MSLPPPRASRFRPWFQLCQKNLLLQELGFPLKSSVSPGPMKACEGHYCFLS